MSGRGRSGGYGSGGGSGGGGISSIAGLTASAITASQLKTALAIATGDVIGFTADAAAAAPVQSVAGMTGAPTAAQVKTALAIATGDVAGFAAAAAAAAPVQSVAGLTGAPTAAQIKTALAIATGDVAGFIAAAAAAAPVQSVAGLTGAPTAVQVKTALAIATGDVAGFTAAAASAAPVQSVAGLTGAPTAAQVKTALAIDASDIVTGTLAIARLGDGTIPASKLVNMANGTIRGRISAGSGAPEDLTPSQVKSLLALTTSDISGLFTAPTWAVLGGWSLSTYTDSGTNLSGTCRRISQPTKRAVNRVAGYFPPVASTGLASSGDTAVGTPQIYAADIAWPAANTPFPFTVNGRRLWAVVPDGPGVLTDPINVPIPAGSQPAVRVFERSLRPPSSVAAAAAAGGAIAANTYYIKLTSFCAGAESVASAEVTATTASTNLAISLTWVSHRDDEMVGIYIGTATGVNKRIAVVPAAAGAFTLTSIAALGSEVPVVNASPLMLMGYHSLTQSGEAFNRLGNGGDGGNYTGVSTAITGQTGPSSAGGPIMLLLGDVQTSSSDPCIYELRDSIGVGTGLSGAGGIYALGLGGLMARPLWNRNKESWMVHGIGGSRLDTLINGTAFGSGRLDKLRFCRVFYSGLGTNDLGASQTWLQLATNQLTLAKMMPAWVKFRLETIPPRTVNTDFGMTISGQTPDAANTNRVLYNTWIRNGCQVDGSGVPVQSGGTSSPFIDWANYLDTCLAVEVNASNVLTLNGGYWITPTAATLTGLTLTAATGFASGAVGTLTASGTPFTVGSTSNPGNGGRVVKITSGAQSGKLAVVNTNTTSALTTYANGLSGYTGGAATASAPITASPSLPASGDTCEVWKCSSIDGIHPTEWGYSLIETVVNTHLTALYG